MKTNTPEALGYSTERLRRIGQVMGGYIDEGKLPGIATLVARRGQIVHLETRGWADIEKQTPITEETIYRIYSMTKPITIVAAMMLFEEGRFLLDDPVSAYLPELGKMQVLRGMGESGPILSPPARSMTIRHLMTHTAGLTYGLFAQDSPGERMYREANLLRLDHTLAEMVSQLQGLPLLFDPGERWLYSVSIDVIGRLIEVISGKSFDQFLEERLFEPLGMKDTGFYVPASKADRLATLYTIGPNGQLMPMPAPVGRDYTQKPAFLSGGGGLVSTIKDYWRFAQMLANGGELDRVRLLSPRTVALIRSNHLPPSLVPYGDPPHMGHGFGLGVRVLMDPAAAGQLDAPGSFGWSGLASTDFWVDPALQVVGIIMMQFVAWPAFAGYPTAAQFRNLAYQALIEG